MQRLSLLSFFAILSLVLNSTNLEMKFISGLSRDAVFYFVAGDEVVVSSDKGYEKKISKGQKGELLVPEGVTSIKFSFDKPEYIEELHLQYEYTRIYHISSMITDIKVNGLSELKFLYASGNNITKPITDLPETCIVNYDNQQSIPAFEVETDNIIDLYDYPSNEWTIEWYYDKELKRKVPTSYYETLEGNRYRFLQNSNNPIRVHLIHSTGLELTSNSMILDKKLKELITLYTDGSAINSNFTIHTVDGYAPLTIGVNGEYFSTDGGILNIPLSSLKPEKQTIELNVNYPSNIKSLIMPGLGITQFKLTSEINSLHTIDLSNNSFTLFSLPSILGNCEYVYLENQKEFLISPKDDNTFDFSDLIEFGGIILWTNEYGDIIPDDYYEEENGIYKFNKSVRNARVLLKSKRFSTFTSYSNFVNIDLQLHFYPIVDFMCIEDTPISMGQIYLSKPTILEIDGIITNDVEGIIDIDFTKRTATEWNYGRTLNHSFTLRTPNPENVTQLILKGLGIENINLSKELNNLILVDIRENHLDFTTFPDVNFNCQLLAIDQAPIDLSVNTATGIVRFPGFKDCQTIRVLSQNGSTISPSGYEINEENTELIFKTSVSNVRIIFGDHPKFPNVWIETLPITYFNLSGIEEISTSEYFNISKNIISLNRGLSADIINLNGTTYKRINSGKEEFLPPGIWIIKLSNNEIFKVKVN